MSDSKLIVRVTTYTKMIDDDDATVLLEKEREFLKDPKAFKEKLVEGVKRGGKDKSQRISQASVKVIYLFFLSKIETRPNTLPVMRHCCKHPGPVNVLRSYWSYLLATEVKRH